LTAVAGASIGIALLFFRAEAEPELEVAPAVALDDELGDDGDPLLDEPMDGDDDGVVRFEEIGGGEPDEHGSRGGVFGKAKSFRQAMLNAGLSPSESTELELALTGALDFRRCRESDAFTVERDAQGRLVRFEYHASSLEYVVAE